MRPFTLAARPGGVSSVLVPADPKYYSYILPFDTGEEIIEGR